MRVAHTKFGQGKITDIENLTSDLKITVVFDDAAIGKKSLLSKYANLTVIG